MRRWRVLVVTVVCCIGADVRATTFTVPLPTGTFRCNDPETSVSFDLGTRLQNVQSVMLQAQGQIMGGIDYWGRPFSWSFDYYLSDDPSPGYGWYAKTTSAGAATWPVPEALASTSSFSFLGISEANWDFLLDGHAVTYLEFGIGWVPETPPRSFPSGTISSAAIVIEATVLPEPGMTSLMTLGGLMVGLRRRARRRKI